MTLEVDEFIRRFLLHALPSGLRRIRHGGWLANCRRKDNLARCRQLLAPLADLLSSFDELLRASRTSTP